MLQIGADAPPGAETPLSRVKPGSEPAPPIEESAGRRVAMATVYASLNRLEARGLVKSRLGDPTPERGGKAKRIFSMTAAGIREVQDARRALTQLWSRLPELKGQWS